MKNLTLNEIQTSEKETLLLFRDFCDENRLRYYLTFGTLLGAARHGGFIPWDDDVDVFLPRKDYNYLLAHFNEWQTAKSQRREVISRANLPDFYCNFAKIVDRNTRVTESGQTLEIGIWIDLFPMDEIGSFLRASLFILKMRICAKLLSYSSITVRKGRKWYKNLAVRLLHAVVPSEKPLLRYRQRLIAKTETRKGGDRYALLYRDFGKIGVPVMQKSLFDPPTVLSFEGEPYCVPREYDAFLRACYGDYTVLPPEEERVSHHHYTCAWKEDKSMKKVITFGVFDYFHIGHLNLLVQAKEHGDFLTVAVQEEDSIRKYKPDAEVFYTTDERVRLIRALRVADRVVTYRDVDQDIQLQDFDIFAVGEDQNHAGFQRAIQWCAEHGKEVVRLRYTADISSESIKKRVAEEP